MIDFRCNHCGRSFSVPDNRSGERGKCPACGNIMVVPMRSESTFLFNESELVCSDPDLQILYESIIAAVGSRIRRHRIDEGDRLFFEVFTASDRTQYVIAKSYFDERLGKKRLILYSQVGVSTEPLIAMLTLKAAGKFPEINFSMDEDDCIVAMLITDLDEATDRLWLDFLVVAVAADTLENFLFKWDRV